VRMSRKWQPSEAAFFLPSRAPKLLNFVLGLRSLAAADVRLIDPTISEKNYVVCKKNQDMEIFCAKPKEIKRSAGCRRVLPSTLRRFAAGWAIIRVTRGRPT